MYGKDKPEMMWIEQLTNGRWEWDEKKRGWPWITLDKEGTTLFRT